MPVNKVTWQQVGHVTEAGRYMFRFGWLTIAPDDLAIWTRFPSASFTLVQTLSPPLAAESDDAIVEIDEFHLGAFELHVVSELVSQDIHHLRLPSEVAAAQSPA